MVTVGPCSYIEREEKERQKNSFVITSTMIRMVTILTNELMESQAPEYSKAGEKENGKSRRLML